MYIVSQLDNGELFNSVPTARAGTSTGNSRSCIDTFALGHTCCAIVYMRSYGACVLKDSDRSALAPVMRARMCLERQRSLRSYVLMKPCKTGEASLQ